VTGNNWKLGIATSAVAAGLLAPQAASAQAFYLQEQSSRGAGRAFSGEVADQALSLSGGIPLRSEAWQVSTLTKP
jgi:long-chain fatty acid transport protein